MKRRTATIERYHCYGTPRHHLRVTYRGRVLRWRDASSPGLCFAMADAPDWGAESLQAMKAHARRHGFTHVRIVGDWSGRTKPRGGSLKGATE